MLSPPAALSPSATRWALRAVGVLLVVAAGACLAVGADRPPDPHLLPADATAGLAGHSSPRSRVAGFGQIGFRVVDGRGRVGPVRCALYADTTASRAQGMTGRRDLDGYAAMLFRFFSDTTSTFWNKGVPVPLSIAWFDGAGAFVGTADMPTCSFTCPTFSPGVAYQMALEVPKGGLGHLGTGRGSVLLVGGSCG